MQMEIVIKVRNLKEMEKVIEKLKPEEIEAAHPNAKIRIEVG